MIKPNIVWFVKESPDNVVFDTKETAEIYARLMFPEETITRRYARIYFVEIWTKEEVGQ